MNAPTNTNIASAVAEAQARFTADNPKSKAQLDKAKNFMPGGKHVMFSGLKEFKESLLMCAFLSNTGVEFPFAFEVLTNER